MTFVCILNRLSEQKKTYMLGGSSQDWSVGVGSPQYLDIAPTLPIGVIMDAKNRL